MLYVIKIALQEDKIPAGKAEQYFEAHRQWFKTYFDRGSFLILGPMPNLNHTGLIMAQASSREELDNILAEDVYYSFGGATYEVNEFKAVMVSDSIKDYAE